MSVPETPYTRKEMYLDAIARGESSGIPERPYTREEMYLDAIAKSGGGGGGGDFDAVVDISHTGGTSDPIVFTAVKGSYATLYQMLESGHMPRMLVTYYESVTMMVWCSACIAAYNWDSDYVSFYVMFYDLGIGTYSTMILLWESDDTLHWQ